MRGVVTKEATDYAKQTNNGCQKRIVYRTILALLRFLSYSLAITDTSIPIYL